MAPTTYTDLESGRTATFRACPNMRGCWSFSWDAWSLADAPDTAAKMRVLCMYAALGARTALWALDLFRYLTRGHIIDFVVGCIWAVISFFFIAWCLTMIGQAEGRRKVMAVDLGRWHFDVFLLGAAVVYVGILAVALLGLLSGAGLYAAWSLRHLMWILIFGVAWVCTWPAEPEMNI